MLEEAMEIKFKEFEGTMDEDNNLLKNYMQHKAQVYNN